MKPKDELRLLQHIHRRLGAREARAIRKPWFNVLLWLAFSTVIFALLQLADAGFVGPFTLIICSLVIGTAMGILSVTQLSHRTWVVLKPHLDGESVSERIKQLRS